MKEYNTFTKLNFAEPIIVIFYFFCLSGSDHFGWGFFPFLILMFTYPIFTLVNFIVSIVHIFDIRPLLIDEKIKIFYLSFGVKLLALTIWVSSFFYNPHNI